MSSEEAKKKLEGATDPQLKEVGNLLIDFGLRLTECKAPIVKNGQEIGDIDLIFIDEETESTFLIEVSTRTDNVSEKISKFFSILSDSEIIEMIRKDFNLPTGYRLKRIFFDLSGDEGIHQSVMHLLANQDNKVLLKYDLDYFTDAFEKVKKCAKNDFFSYIKVKPSRRRRIEIDAIQFYLDDVRVYIYVDRVDQLLKYCYVFRRLKDEKGYQRILNQKRINGIANAIKKEKVLAFPNTILISYPDGIKLCNNPKTIEECPSIVKINIPDCYSACRVIDGQHRLLGFARVDENIQQLHNLPVIALEDISLKKEMKTFIDINSTQKSIDKNLILALQADFSWNKKENSKEYFEKIAVEVVKRLNIVSPLKGKIFIPEAMAKREGKITLATLVTQILKNKFIGGGFHLFQTSDDDKESPYREIRNIFSLVKRILPEYSRDVNSFFYTNKGLRILFRFIQIHERNRRLGKIDLVQEELLKDLSNVLNNKYLKELEGYYGEGGATNAVNKIFDSLKKDTLKSIKMLQPI